MPAEPGLLTRCSRHRPTTRNQLDLGFAISEYPGLRSTIRRILHDPRNTRYNIREFEFDPTVRTYQTRKSHNRQNLFETQNGNQFQSEHTYALVTTKGLNWDPMHTATASHATPHAPAVCGCLKR
ncbi:unnamed protein product [Prunus armeniaca]